MEFTKKLFSSIYDFFPEVTHGQNVSLHAYRLSLPVDNARQHHRFVPQNSWKVIFDTELGYEYLREPFRFVVSLRLRYELTLFVCESLYGGGSGQKAVHTCTDVADLEKNTETNL